MHTVFITGCQTGFGHLLAKVLLKRGHRVIATDPNITTLETQLGGPNERLLVLRLDVRSDSDVQAAARRALAWHPVDVLVNNAGFAFFGPQEEVDLTLLHTLFDINVFGPARVSKALLPSLRQTQGIIVQLSSVAGRMVFPESGFYAATKHALEAMSEALAQEVGPFGVRVRVIEPGSFNTCFLTNAEKSSPPRAPSSPYLSLQRQWDIEKNAVLEPPQDPMLVVNAIIEHLDHPSPFLRIPVGADAPRLLAGRASAPPHSWNQPPLSETDNE